MYPQSPWGYPQGPQPMYIPVPQGTDPERVFKMMERLERRADKKKKLQEEEDKKKKGPDKPKAPTFTFPQVLLMLCAFGLPVGGVNLLIMNAILQALKDHLLK